MPTEKSYPDSAQGARDFFFDEVMPRHRAILDVEVEPDPVCDGVWKAVWYDPGHGIDRDAILYLRDLDFEIGDTYDEED